MSERIEIVKGLKMEECEVGLKVVLIKKYSVHVGEEHQHGQRGVRSRTSKMRRVPRQRPCEE
jgi:hypothetical protein